MRCSEKELRERLAAILGADHVIDDRERLRGYGTDQSFVTPRAPLMAVRPGCREEVQEIVRLANREAVPVTPYSSGTTLQGAHIPGAGGAVTIDLSRMKKIHLLDPVSRNAIIEPGVTFSHLQDELKKQGMRVLTAHGMPGSASVLATYLECTPLFSWPRYGAWETLTMEIVLPSGELMGTGQMAIPAAAHPYTWTTPYAAVNRMFLGSQGTLGIVTRAAITVKTDHPAARVFGAGFRELDDAAAAARALMRPDVAEEMFIANAHYLSLFLAKRWPDEFSSIKKESAPWTLVMVVRGEEEEVEIKALDLKDAASTLRVDIAGSLPGLTAAAERVLGEIAYPQGYLNQNRFKGAWNPICCYAARQQLRSFHNLLSSCADAHAYAREELGFFVMPLNHGATFCFEPSFYRDPTNGEESRRVRELFIEASGRLIAEGAFFDRPYPLWAKQVYEKSSHYHSTIEQVKRMLDPNNIMNPGKLGFN